MAEAVKKRPAAGGLNEDVKQAQTVDEVEREMLGPKSRKSPAEKMPKGPKVKKPVGRVEVAVLTSLLWLSIIGAVVLLVIFDPTPEKIIRGNALLLLNPDEDTREEYYMEDIFELQDGWRDLEEALRELEEIQAELDLREEELDEWDNEIADREMEVDLLRESLLVENGAAGITADMARTANVVGRMQAANAAQMLAEMDFERVLRICALIAPKRLAPILDAMDPEFRAELGDAMAAEPEPEDWDW